jgi:hypothetical protein
MSTVYGPCFSEHRYTEIKVKGNFGFQADASLNYALLNGLILTVAVEIPSEKSKLCAGFDPGSYRPFLIVIGR